MQSVNGAHSLNITSLIVLFAAAPTVEMSPSDMAPLACI